MLGVPQQYRAGCQKQHQGCDQQFAAVPYAACVQGCSCSHATQHIQEMGLQQLFIRSKFTITCPSRTRNLQMDLAAASSSNKQVL